MGGRPGPACALGALDGDSLHALPALLPAASAYTTPAAIEFSTAAFNVVEKLPPRLMLAAAGSVLFAVTQSTPAMTPDVKPLPAQSRTRTATRRTFFATP